MKPFGLFLVISGTDSGPHGLDDDYDWHVRDAAIRDLDASSVRWQPQAVSLTQRLAALVRLPRWRAGATNPNA
jgi:hypothetical protein